MPTLNGKIMLTIQNGPFFHDYSQEKPKKEWAFLEQKFSYLECWYWWCSRLYPNVLKMLNKHWVICSKVLVFRICLLFYLWWSFRFYLQFHVSFLFFLRRKSLAFGANFLVVGHHYHECGGKTIDSSACWCRWKI